MHGTRARAAIALILAACTGSALTFAAMRLASRAAPADNTVRYTVAGLPDRYRALDLSADQEQRIRAIVTAARPATDSIMREVLPKLRAQMASVDSQVRAVLTASQVKQLDAMAPKERLLLKRKTGQGGVRVDTVR
jgi:Spy/CpxP family protein refolding chaperone